MSDDTTADGDQRSSLRDAFLGSSLRKKKVTIDGVGTVKMRELRIQELQDFADTDTMAERFSVMANCIYTADGSEHVFDESDAEAMANQAASSPLKKLMDAWLDFAVSDDDEPADVADRGGDGGENLSND